MSMYGAPLHIISVGAELRPWELKETSAWVLEKCRWWAPACTRRAVLLSRFCFGTVFSNVASHIRLRGTAILRDDGSGRLSTGDGAILRAQGSSSVIQGNDSLHQSPAPHSIVCKLRACSNTTIMPPSPGAEPQDCLVLQGLNKVRGFWLYWQDLELTRGFCVTWRPRGAWLSSPGLSIPLRGNGLQELFWLRSGRGQLAIPHIGSSYRARPHPLCQQLSSAYTMHCTSLVGNLGLEMKASSCSWKQLEKDCLCSESYTTQYKTKYLDLNKQTNKQIFKSTFVLAQPGKEISWFTLWKRHIFWGTRPLLEFYGVLSHMGLASKINSTAG